MPTARQKHPEDLRVARVAGGALIVSVPITTDSDGDPLVALSPAQRAVVELVAAGNSNAEIAAMRGTSVRTVAKQIEAAYRRLGLGSRAELGAFWAARWDAR
jgi:DNA-binding NarL/FixJ family response regulator